MKPFLMIILILSFVPVFTQNSTLTIDFEIAKYSNGKIYVAIYNKEESFLKELFKGEIVEVKNGKARAIIEDLPLGEYAVSSFYDKNNNGKLDTNFLSIPKEPIAVSNNAKGSFGPPKYKDAKFTLATKKKNIKIKF